MNPYQQHPQSTPQATYNKLQNDESTTQPMDPMMPVRASVNQYAAEVNPLIGKQRSNHIRALIATIWVLGGETFFIYMYASNENWQNSLGVVWFLAIIIIIYCIYLMIALCCNPIVDYLGRMKQGQHFNNQYDMIRGLIGTFVMHAQCYHYQTRYHTRTVTDSDGTTRTQTYTTQEKVVTHTATQHLSPNRTIDQSGNVDQIRAMTQIVFIHFIVDYAFGDPQSHQYFMRVWESFKVKNTMDSYQNFNYLYKLPPFSQRQSFFVGTIDCQFSNWLYITTMFGLVWPYSLWVQTQITRYDVKFLKKVFF